MAGRKDRDPYVRLAQAIIASGIKHNDMLFLHSDWCETLRALCDLADNMTYKKDAMSSTTRREVSRE